MRSVKSLWVNLALMLGLITPAAKPQEHSADTELAASRAAHEKGDFQTALRHAQMAVNFEPEMIEAHFALASIASDLCIPNAQPGPDEHVCNLAIQGYEKVLNLDASHQEALRNLAYLLYQFYRLQESEGYYRKGLSFYPDDPELLCGVAVFDYHHSATDLAMTKIRLNLSPRSPLINSALCIVARDRNKNQLDEGIALILRAIQIRANDVDLLGHVSALYSVRAEIECGNPKAYTADVKAARTWDRKRKDLQNRGARYRVLQECPPAGPPWSVR